MEKCEICSENVKQEDIDCSAKYEVCMCTKCRRKLAEVHNQSSKLLSNKQILVYMALEHRGLKPEIEWNDSYKTVDIAILDAKVYIEINGEHHVTDAYQHITDMKRSYYSILDGYLTLNVFNQVIPGYLNEIANTIKNICTARVNGGTKLPD